MEGHKLVFLAGLHRSGTTLLARLLTAHPQISGFSGTDAPADEGQHLQSVYPSDHEYGRPGRFGFSPEMHLTESSPLVSEKRRTQAVRGMVASLGSLSPVSAREVAAEPAQVALPASPLSRFRVRRHRPASHSGFNPNR